MDAANPFETPTTFRLHRAEYMLGVIVSTVLIVVHLGEIRWLAFAGLFLYIDLIGYIPGAIAYHRSETKRISKVYYVMYNTMHSLVTQSLVVGLWGWTIGWEWALLAIPFHVFGDRAVFGNFMKTFSLPFEPVRNVGYTRLIDELQTGVQVDRAIDELVAPQRHR
jgi:hypothetical protein